LFDRIKPPGGAALAVEIVVDVGVDVTLGRIRDPIASEALPQTCKSTCVILKKPGHGRTSWADSQNLDLFVQIPIHKDV
jgi:hypothetical protein